MGDVGKAGGSENDHRPGGLFILAGLGVVFISRTQSLNFFIK